MAFLLGRGTAIEWLRMNTDLELVKHPWVVPYPFLEGSRTRLDRHLPLLKHLSIPYQIIVWNGADRRRTSLTQSHVLTTQDGFYPALHLTDELYVSTPAFTFLQMASVLDEEHLQFLGFELCGRYGIDNEGVFLREQVSSPEELLLQAERMPRIRGRRKAIAVAPKVLGGAASPMEAALALILSSSRDEGGYGIEAPELNHPLPVEGDARRLWDEDHITPDLLWEEQKLAIEYDSDLHHTPAMRIATDARRRDVLTELGYRVITVTTERMRTYREIERIASMAASHLGVDISAQSEDELNRRTAFQARKRHLATHPEELLALPPASNKRAWHPSSTAK